MPLILGTNSIKDTGFNVSNSLRFNSGSSDSLARTPSSASNRKTFTISYWVKRAKLGAEQNVCGVHENSSHNFNAMFNTDDNIEMKFKIGGANNKLQTNAKFRDISAWMHIVLAVDTTDGTASNRFKLYINGVQETSFDTASYPNQNVNTEVNLDALSFKVGRSGNDSDTDYLDGYLAEFCLIDGSQLAADQFGEFDSDSNIWKPIDVSGLTFGTNGFYLQFKESGTSANASGLGADTSGNTNHFTVNNLTAVDQSIDTCTNNFCTLNPLDNSTAVSFDLSQGNLVLGDIGSGDNDHGLRGTFGVNAGKWYYEVKRLETSGTFGVIGSEVKLEFDLENETSGPAHIMSSNGTGSSLVYWNDGSFTNNASLQGYAANDIIGVALDMDNGKLFFSINGVFKGFDNNASDPAAGTNANFTDIPTDGTFMMPYVSKRGTANPSDQYNFGGTQSFTISSGNTDGKGFGNFEYAPPSGFLALCTKNLAETG